MESRQVKKYNIEESKNILSEFLSMPLNSGDNIFKKFLDLNGIFHYPQKKETIRKNNIVFSNSGKEGERFFFINGDKKDGKILFVAHVDTILSARAFSNEHYIIEDDGIICARNRWTNKPSVLGADDRAGVSILYMLVESGHSILLCDGEEIGGIGATYLNTFTDIISTINEEHQFMVEFDRRGASDYKMYHMGTPTFRTYIENIFGYHEPDMFAFTDISCLDVDISGVNLSVGYYNEHTVKEYIKIDEWYNTYSILIDYLNSNHILPRFEQENNLWNKL